MKGQYFSFDALIGALVFLMIIVVAIGMFFSSTFSQKIQEEELRLYALKVAHTITSPYSYASFYSPEGPVMLNSVTFNTIARKINDISPYQVSIRVTSLGACSFHYPVYTYGMSATVYRIVPLNVECGGYAYYNVPSLIAITVSS